MTITQRLEFGVLSAPLAALDSRTLSQAWFSALYGHCVPGREGASSTQRPDAESSRSAARVIPQAKQRPQSFAPLENRRRRAARETSTADGERRMQPSRLARNIERALCRCVRGACNASFTVPGKRGRVHVLLSSRGGRMYLIALCAPRMRPMVATALARARCTLASRGIALATSVHGDAA